MREHEIVGSLVFHVSAQDFARVPGSPIVYWLGDAMLKTFTEHETLDAVSKVQVGLQTGDNNRFVREWWEVSAEKISFDCANQEEAFRSGAKWFPYNKGGEFRRWYGNREFVVNWQNGGHEIRKIGTENGGRPRSRVQNVDSYFCRSISWSLIGSGDISFRYYPTGNIIDHASGSFYANQSLLYWLLSFTNSSTAAILSSALSSTLNANVGLIGGLPFLHYELSKVTISKLVECAKNDWDSYEISWQYQQYPLLSQVHSGRFENNCVLFSKYCLAASAEQRQREIRNNELVADAYGIRDDVSCNVPLERVSLKRNSAFVYPDKTPAERDELFARDMVKEFISYAVGCMFGRYSIDKPGLILASQSETVEDFHERVPDTRFEPDKDNVIPVTEIDCFEDDIVSRFRRFLEVTFGSGHLTENLAYIERTLGKPLRKYFVNDFYNDHVAMYKNRPIYWQYSSRTDNKGTFKALIYMHRYTPATTHTVLEYLRDFTAKLADQANQLERSDRAKDKREAEKLHKAVTECKAYEDNVLYPLATRNLEIDLDDGVLVNYLRMGQALRAIAAIEKKRKDVATWTWPVHPLEEDWR